MTPLQKLLKRLRACAEAREWCGEKTLCEAWATCERGDWLVWLASRMDWLDRPVLVSFACDCAERVLPIFEAECPGDSRPRVALETARRWVLGGATAEECRFAADAAAYAYASAVAAVYAADAVAAWASAAYAAVAAWASAYASAADAAAYADAAAAYADAAAAAERLWQADRLREIYTPEPLEGE